MWGFDATQWQAIQAIGTLVALLIAISVPAVQHCLDNRRAEHRDKLRTRALAIRLLVPFDEVYRALTTADTNLRKLTDPSEVRLKPAVHVLNIQKYFGDFGNSWEQISFAPDSLQEFIYQTLEYDDWLKHSSQDDADSDPERIRNVAIERIKRLKKQREKAVCDLKASFD